MDKEKVYIEVAVALPMYKTYTYLLPEHLIDTTEIAFRVLVPFGKRAVTGYVLSYTEKPDSKIKVKEIIETLDQEKLFPESMIPFFKWISDYYIHPIGEVIQCALPGGLNISEKSYLICTDKKIDSFNSDLNEKELSILKGVGNGILKKTLINSAQFKISESEIGILKKKGFLIEERRINEASSRKKQARYVRLIDFDFHNHNLTKKRLEILEHLKNEDDCSVLQLKEIFPTINSFLNPLRDMGLIEIYNKEVFRDPFGEEIEPDSPKELTDEQQIVVNEVRNSLGQGFKSFLLSGVTGSGKTEVYMQIAQKAMDEGYNVIVLVPEISLISQTERRFRARFGERTAVLHSGLSHGERYDQWRKILKGGISISIGVRSSIFAPFAKTGLIIVDEEHDQSYKQDSTLRYNARDLALVRGKFADCPVLLGSATPSVQSLFNVRNGKFTELYLKNRVNRMPLPEIKIVDLKKYRDYPGIRKYVSDELVFSIKRSLEKKEQVILFINRRGFSTYPVCSVCGETVKCTDCETSLTLHKNINAYKCHLCGFSKASASNCVKCGSEKIKHLGIGTEKIEEFVKHMFPEANTERLDQDTVKGKNTMFSVLKRMRNRETDILIGTQMIAKGHDFPRITLVGILCADMSLNFPDFRSSERTFQLLAQVAGRSGRGETEGKVILQTYTPEHFTIESARKQDYSDFFEKELSFRNSLLFPPYTRIIQLKISGKNVQNVKDASSDIGLYAKDLLKKYNEYKIDIMGPVEAPLSKVAGRYRWQILFKSANTAYLNNFVRNIKDSFFPSLNKNIRVSIDVDPFSMM